MSTEIIKVPDIGGAEGVEVIEICVAVGDEVAAEDSLLVLESDKASMEVPSPMAGKILSIKVSEGDTISEGSVIMELQVAGAASTSPEPTAQEEPELQAQASVEQPVETSTVESAGSAEEVVNVPDIGGSEAVDAIEICVAVGDEVSEGDSLVVLESDKASMEIPSPKAGKVLSVNIKEGDKVSEGDKILVLEVIASVASSHQVAAAEKPALPTPAAAQPSPQPEISKASKAAVSADTNSTDSASIYAGPAVRKLARELGVDLSKVQGSGPKGRLLKDDVQAFVKKALTEKPAVSGAGIPAVPAVDYSRFGSIDIQPMSKLHKLTAVNMQRSWLNVPHVTQFDEADISDLEDFRAGLKQEAEKRGVKITPLAFIMKAAAAALKTHPLVNASLYEDGGSIIYKDFVNIGMAVDTPAGLVVPVIRDVDQKSVWDLAAETAELAAKAKKRKLSPAEMQGGGFTVSSLGSIGGTGFTPIVNAPEVAILGVSKRAIKPHWNGSEFVPRKMLPLSLSYDHRALNGVSAGKFFTDLTALLADIRRLVL